MMTLPPPLWAVHIADTQLTASWCAGGYVVAGLFALWGAWRIREEEIPQLAVLTAAFFLVSMIHVPVPGGPRTHLLMNGLLGVVLGRRAILAVIVGLFLQSALSVMGGVGFGTLGVNACVMGLPALVAWGLFAGLQRLPWIRNPGFRAALVALSIFLFVLSMCYALTTLVSNYPTDDRNVDLSRANWLTFHPLTLVGALLLGGLAAWAEHRLDHAVEFPVGLLIGEVAVLLTILLNGLALIGGGTSDWTGVVLLTFVIHLPLAVLEGIILGFIVGFLARVKPQLLYGYYRPQPLNISPALPATPRGKILALVFTPFILLAGASPAFAHHLLADYRVLPEKRIQIESWFDLTGDSANGAKVMVLNADGNVLLEGLTNAQGMFVFPFDKAETLTVKVNAGMGHEKILQIPEAELAKFTDLKAGAQTPAVTEKPAPFANRTSQLQFRDILIALAFIFGLAAFVLSVRHSYTIRELRRQLEALTTPPPSRPVSVNGSASASEHIRRPLS